jgi:site-specific recombinase XerD
MLEVLFATGMRISELCSLNRDQIDGSGRIFITGKGKKQRFVYLTRRAQEHLERYLATRQDDFPALFVPYSGRNVTKRKKRISTNYLQARIKWYRERLQINVPTSAHSLRHGFATYLAEEGANPAAIQILLGHESLDTTTRYVHASDKYAEETHKKYHPLAQPD